MQLGWLNMLSEPPFFGKDLTWGRRVHLVQEMDIKKLLTELRLDRERLLEAILSLERLATESVAFTAAARKQGSA